LSAAGGVTRSNESWEKQLEAIDSRDAFLVYISDRQSGLMVGGGFFHSTRDECYYAVGAYDRSMFDKPLGHVVQYRAMQEMKDRNIKWYKLGDRPYPEAYGGERSKEITIADFKQGFATHTFPCFDISW
jgi:FemAB family protein